MKNNYGIPHGPTVQLSLLYISWTELSKKNPVLEINIYIGTISEINSWTAPCKSYAYEVSYIIACFGSGSLCYNPDIK
jgi:hypothetical protein